MDAPHILLVSIPAPGHVFPFTSFAHQLASAGAQVTCFTTGYVFQHLQHRGDHKYESSSTNRVRFEGLLDFQDTHEVIVIEKVMHWIQPRSDEEMRAALERRFLKLQPRPCCIVADLMLGWVQDVADKLRVPRHTLFTMSAKTLALLIRLPELFKRGELPFKGLKKDIILPGMAPVPGDDVWRTIADESETLHQSFIETFGRLGESSSIIVNTFEDLEADSLKALRADYAAAGTKVPEILPILLSNIPRMPITHGTDTNDQVSEVEKWLDTQAPASVIYVSFGSLATLTEQQTGALALALEAVKCPFVWVHRPPGVSQVSKQSQADTNSEANLETTFEYFPPGATNDNWRMLWHSYVPDGLTILEIYAGFPDRVRGRAMFISGWAPQPQILIHHAIGAFLTHCGWNSTLESVCAGVPMLCWPFWADQKMNARFVTDTIHVGLRVKWGASNDTVDQHEIEKVLKQMMDGEQGKAARSKALTFRLLAQKNVADGGASKANLEKLLQQCTSTSPCHGTCAC